MRNSLKYKISFFLFFSLLLCQNVIGQERYNAEVFPEVIETSNVLFSTAVPEVQPGGGFYEWLTGYPLNVDEFDTEPIDLYMDIFEPAGDELEKRPVIIICFGGGFLSGSRDHWSMREIAMDFARRGYVAATIDYRLGMNIFDADLSTRAVYRGLQDGRSAVRFFRADSDGADNYRIDPDNIFIGGHSSGGFIGLHNIYLDKESERPISTFDWEQEGISIPDLGCLDCVGDNQEYSGDATAVFSLAGAVGFTSFIETADDGKVVMFHSEDDGTVPYDEGGPFSTILILVIGDDLPDVYGSLSIAERCDSVGLPYSFFSYTDRGHDVHEETGSSLYSDIVPGISDWFFDQYLIPDSHNILGSENLCESNLQQAYTIPVTDATNWDWSVSGGVFDQQSSIDNTAIITWDLEASEHLVEVVPYNCIDAMGETSTLEISLHEPSVNTFIAGITSDWTDSSVWSNGYVPLPCDTVVLPASVLPLELRLAPMVSSQIRALYIEDNNNLILDPSAVLEIKPDE
jgi:hypothetical protein